MKIDHEVEKRAYEAYAKAILESLLSDVYKDLEIKDSPDLQMVDRGVEVTRAFYPDQGEALGLFIKHSKQSMEDVPAGTLRRMQKKDIHFFESQERIFAMHQGRGQFYSSLVFMKAYQKKLKKAMQYKEFDVLDLFIFDPPPEDSGKQIIESFFKSINESVFQSIMVFTATDERCKDGNYHHLLYRYDTHSKQRKIYELTPENERICKTAAQEYVYRIE